MSFATKKDLMNWAKEYLKRDGDGELIDAVDGDDLEPIKRKFGWTFMCKPDSWFWQVEDMTTTTPEDAQEPKQ